MAAVTPEKAVTRAAGAIKPVALAVAYALAGASAWAAPQGEQVVAGQAVVNRNGAATLITQGTDRAAINWQSFSIGAGESVRFAQPSSSSVVLNRVVGQNPSEILGSLSANGQVFLVNPNGVLFGKGARVDVGGLVASTLGISNSDFMARRYRFDRFGADGITTGGAQVVNAGDIIANGGYVALIGPQVKNYGSITATSGSVALAAGDQITLSLTGNKLIGLTVDKGALNALVDNKGLIRADGGQVLLTAKAADQIIQSVVNNDGIVEAGTLKNVNGVIRLESDTIANSGVLRADGGANQSGGSITLASARDTTLAASSVISASGARGGDITVQASGGTLRASGRIEAVGSDTTGGTIQLLGERVGLMAGAAVDASGKSGGGTVLVGGDYQGNNANVQNAQRTYVDAAAGIKADATASGDGGKVIVWADDVTRFYGSISAQGGAASGNGGSVEVSGKGTLDFSGSVNTLAANGRAGTLLLDPTNIEVVTGGTAILTDVDAFADADQTTCAVFGSAACSRIAPATINAAGATVTLQATNNITFTNAISIATAGVGLNATATTGTINVNAGITVSKSGTVSLTAAKVASSAAGTITTTGAAGLAGGNVSIISTSGAVTLAGAITTSGGAGAAGQAGGAAGSVTIKGATTTTTAAITSSGGNGGTGAGFAGGAGGAITVESNGALVTGVLNANGGNGGGTTAAGGNAGTISVTNLAAAGTVTTGALTARGGGAVGAVVSGAAGSVSVKNTANALLQAGAIDTRGQAGGDGGSVSLISTGNVSETSTIQTTGGALNAGTTAAGRAAGNITVTGVAQTITGAVTASGGAGLGTNQAGGKAGVVSITGTGALSTAAITSSTGNATGTGAGGTAGSITLSGTIVTTGALTTTGGANGAGGNISVTSTTGATTINGAVASSGGAAVAAVAAGSNAGKIIINSAGTLSGTGLTLTASGSNATGPNLAGGSGALIDVDAVGAITIGNIAASGGNGVATNAAGGNAGSIFVTNNSVTTGAITTGTLAARTGAAAGTGAGGAAGSISVINSAAGQAISTATIDSSGQTSGAGGDVTINGKGNITVTGNTAASGAALGTGATAAGRGAGNVTISGGVDTKITGAITANGGAGLGTNQAGGKAGMVSVTGTGVLTATSISAFTGAATGTGAGGTAGSITLGGSTVTTTALNTAGGANGAGGNISVTSTTGATAISGAVNSSGGTANAGVAGSNAGKIIINSAGDLTGAGLSLSATGSAANGAALNLAGGHGALIDVDAVGVIAIGNISAGGGNASTTNANGGNAGSIAVTNNSVTAGAITTGILSARTGAAQGTGAGGTAGSISVINNAAGQTISTQTIDASGQTSGAGGDVTISGKGNNTVTGGISTSGAALGAGTTAAGRGAGNITISGVDNKITGAITAIGGAGLGTNQAGGKAGAVSITGTGVLAAVAISVNTGAATGTGAGGAAGSITLSGSTVTAGALTTAGGANGAGGNISVTSSTGATTINGTVNSSGGAANAGVAGSNAGKVILNSAGDLSGAGLTLTASGSTANGAGLNLAGGNGALIDLDSAGAITVGTVTASGGNASTTNAKGGDAGSIAITNNSVTTGGITTGALTARTGAAQGTGAGGAAGSISVINNAAGQAVSTQVIDTSGQTSGAGGDVTVTSKGNVTVTGTILTSGATLGAGTTAAGRGAGNITINGVDNKITGAIAAIGGAGLGTNQAGGKAGVVSITGTGVLTAAAITVNTGAATGTGAGGTAGSITLTGNTATTGALTTSGGANGAGGNISLTTTGGAATINGAVVSSGGAANAGVAGANAGKIIINSAGDLTGAGLTLTANGSGANGVGLNLAGGNGALIDLDSAGAITVGTISASGGNASTTNAKGGDAGSIAITNNSAAIGAVSTGTLTARTGAAAGTGAGGTAGSIVVINNATSQTTNTLAIDSSGQVSGAGGAVTINGKGNITVTGAITTSGAALGGGTAAGRAAGNITISGGVDNTVTGAINATGGAGLGTNQAGGKAGVVSISGTGVLTTAAITASTGTATGTGAGGTAGSIALSGSTATTGALTTSGGSNGAGGNISVTGTSGGVTIGGAITANGGNSLAAAVAGGGAGTITLDAGGGTPTITLAGNLSAVGGNKSGAGTDGAGAQIRLMDAVLLNAATVTVSALGGSAGTGAGGAVLFDGAVDSAGGARSLVVNTNGNTVFTGKVGSSSPLQTLTTDALGTTKINGGAVTTVGTQTYNDTLVFGAATNLNTTDSAVVALGAVTATAGALTFATGVGDITMNNAANDFGMVAVTSGKNVTLRDKNALDLGTSAITGTLTVNTTGAITQSGALAVTGLTTLAAGAANNITLSNTGNDFSTVAVTSGNNVTINDKNAMTAGPVTSAGNVLLQTTVGAGNDLTLAGNIMSTGGGITLASGEDIHYGTSSLSAATRWLTYSVDPANDTGTIPTPGNPKPNIYNSTFAALGSGVVLPGTGNHHVYSAQPSLTYTANAAARIYGAANPAFSGAVTGLVNGDTAADAYSGTITFTSPATAASNVGSYAINGSGLTSDIGYKFVQAPANATALTINPATLTYTANAANRLYGAADPAFNGAVTGFVLGETQAAATTGTLAFNTTAVANSNVGSYAINGSGLAANNGNYVFVQAPANATAFTINPATLTYTANAANRLYGAADPAFSGTVTGFVLGETQATATTGALSFTTPAVANSKVGSYAINGGGLAANNGNYVFVQAPANATAFTINPATLTYTANAANRLYGAADPAFSGTVTGFVLGETQATATTGALTFTSPAVVNFNVGSYAINGGGLTANNGNYVFVQAPANATAFTINPATLTYTANAANRLYGAADPAFSGTVTGFVLGETQATATTGALAFTSPAVVNSNVGSYVLNGGGLAANNGNYVFAQAPANATAFTINPATLTYTANAVNRLYGAADPAFGGTVTGFVLGETQGTATTGTLAFTTPAVANSNVGSYALNGVGLAANNGNYVFVQAPANATAFTINPATLTYTANAANRLYGAADPALSGNVTGFVLGETQGTATTGTLSFTTPAVANSNVGSYAINGGGLAANNGNYVFVQAPANATAFTINPATLIYTANAVNRLYGAADPALSGSVTGFVLGETQGTATAGALTFNTTAVATSNVGSYAINGSGLAANNGNYIFAQAPGNATAFTVNPAIVSLAGSRTYDVTNTFAGATFGAAGTINTGIGGQTLLVTGGPGAVASANVAAGTQPLTLGGLTLTNGTGLASNYTLTGGTHTGTVTAKTVNLAASRVYDGTANFSAGGFTPTITGTVGAETLTIASGSGTVASANVAAGVQTLITSTLALGDGSGLASNYTLAGGTQTGMITAKTLTGAIIGTPTKVYSGNTSALLGPANFSLSGFVGAESATVTQTAGVYNSKDVLTANNVTAALAGGDFVAGGGTLLGNYTLPVSASGVATIMPAALTGNVTAANKVYDTTTVATITGRTLTGVIGADVVTYSGGTATFADKNAALGKVVTATGLGLTGADAGNYTVNTTALTNANITPAAIANVTGITAANKVYDTTPSAALNTVAAGFTGLLAGDVLTVATATGAFTDKNAANGKTVNISGITLGGADAGNYTLTSNVATATANITPAAITNVTGIAANNKVYDATTVATLNTVTAGFTGLLAGDALTVAAATGAFTDKNAAIGKSVNISGITLGGADAGNYTLTTNTATATANITPAVLTVTYTGVNKIYDATTAATVITGDNRLGADVLTINRSANFADANAGIAKPVAVTGVSLNGADAGNYTVAASGTATADITARGITVTANNANKVYGNADPALTFNVGGAGLAGVDSITSVFSGALARVPGENVAGGPYVINGGALASNGNYSISGYTPGQLIITPRALTVTADNQSGNVGQPLPPFTASYNGFAFNETSANLAGALAFATPATNTSPPGAYTITPSGLSSSNYSITYVNGTLSLQPGASAVPGDILSSVNAGVRQLPPPFLSGPLEGGPPSLATNLFVAMQPSNVTGGTPAGGAKPDAGVPLRPLLTGAVKHLVDIVNGGLRVPDSVEVLTVGTISR